MTFDLTIDGVPQGLKAGSLRINRTMNQRATATFTLISRDRSYRPALDAPVVLARDGTTIFAGLITTPREQGFFGGVKPPIATQVTVGDFNMYADRRAVKEDLPAGTLLAALEVLETYLTGYGITLHASQVTGPTLPALIWDYKRLSDCLAELSTLTAQFGDQYIWSIDFDKVLRMYQPSTVAAPFDLIEEGNGAIAEITGDLTVEKTRETFANRIIVKVPKKVELGRLEQFSGDDVTDTFALEYQLTRFPYGVIRRYTDAMVPSGGETFGHEGELDGNGDPVQWWYLPDTNEIVRNIGPAEDGFIYEIEFDGEFEGVGIATADPPPDPEDLVEKVITVEEVPEDQTAQSLAEGYLAQSLSIQHTIGYRTRLPGLEPGMVQAVTATSRAISGTLILTDVNIYEFGAHDLIYDVKAVLAGDTNVLKSYRDLYKVWRGDLAGGAGTSASIGTPPTTGPTMGPALPFESVQFNRSGTFGGNDHFLFKEDPTTVLIGPGHTVSSTSSDNLLVGEGHTVV